MLDKHLWRDFVAVTSSVAVLGVGVGSTLPLTALLLTARGLGPEVVGWMTAAVAAGGVIGTFSAPPATLRFGRKRVMLICVTLAALSVVSLQLIDSLWGWAILRAAFGAAMAPLFVIGEAWINSLPGDASRGRVVAIYTTSFTLCQVVGPLLTDALTRVPEHAFLICGAVFLLGIPGRGIAAARDAAPATQRNPANPHSYGGNPQTATQPLPKRTAPPPGGPLSAWPRPSLPERACSPPSTILS
jgi:MFS family permease